MDQSHVLHNFSAKKSTNNTVYARLVSAIWTNHTSHPVWRQNNWQITLIIPAKCQVYGPITGLTQFGGKTIDQLHWLYQLNGRYIDQSQGLPSLAAKLSTNGPWLYQLRTNHRSYPVWQQGSPARAVFRLCPAGSWWSGCIGLAPLLPHTPLYTEDKILPSDLPTVLPVLWIRIRIGSVFRSFEDPDLYSGRSFVDSDPHQ